ncbi:MAG: hypothetical protein M3303_10525 [Gemmatimonadota bacterium]|nr:hypothetical protein [Gemmatimonadota bacterium]
MPSRAQVNPPDVRGARCDRARDIVDERRVAVADEQENGRSELLQAAGRRR